jgi:hypothetical protein
MPRPGGNLNESSYKVTAMRNEVTKIFSNLLGSTEENITRVAVLGGTSSDPEAKVLKERFPLVEFHFLNIDNPTQDSNFHLIDINESSSLPNYKYYFDLVVSSQVIEHIWNHHNFFELLCDLVRPSGLIWVNCPKSNMVHGSPHFFSAGFTSTYLAKNLENRNCKILDSGEIGNRRYYLGIHFARYWQTSDENRHPLLRYNFQSGTFHGIVWKFIKDLPSRVLLTSIQATDSRNQEFATESFVWAKTP